MSQEEVLTILQVFGPMGSARLAEGLGLSPSTIHTSLKSLRKQGLVWWMKGKSARGGSCGIWGAF